MIEFIKWWWSQKDEVEKYFSVGLLWIAFCLISALLFWSPYPLIAIVLGIVLILIFALFHMIYVHIRELVKEFKTHRRRQETEIIRRLREGTRNAENW